jgi:hypothetical protein
MLVFMDSMTKILALIEPSTVSCVGPVLYRGVVDLGDATAAARSRPSARAQLVPHSPTKDPRSPTRTIRRPQNLMPSFSNMHWTAKQVFL